MTTREPTPAPTPAVGAGNRERTVRPVVRRGRPKGGNSDETREAILAVALIHFAELGYASTTISGIAADAGLATSAVYHYYGGKEALYEAVFFAVAPQVWEGMAENVADTPTMVEGVEALMRNRGGTRAPHVSPFLASLPTVAVLHPEFKHLLQARTKFQDRVFRALAELGLRTGEFAGFTVDEATDLLRSVVMGWFFERFFVGADRDDAIPVVVKALKLMTVGAQHSADTPKSESRNESTP